MKPLSKLRVGESGMIATFKEELISLRLMEMGCVPGEHIKVVGMAPLGDPIAILVSGYTLAIRKAEAENILIVQGSKFKVKLET